MLLHPCSPSSFHGKPHFYGLFLRQFHDQNNDFQVMASQSLDFGHASMFSWKNAPPLQYQDQISFQPKYLSEFTQFWIKSFISSCWVICLLIYANLCHCENKIDFSIVKKSLHCGRTLKFSTRSVVTRVWLTLTLFWTHTIDALILSMLKSLL